MHKISIIVPAYNERPKIETFITALKETMQNNPLLSELIVVDDHSNDGTTDILKNLDIALITHHTNFGYGAALKSGIAKAINEFICIIDSDNEFHPEEINRLLPYVNEYDMIVGSRTGNSTRTFPFYQKFAKGFICSLLSLVFKQKILDINSGLRLIRKDAVKKYIPILSDGFSFTSSITLAMLIDKHRIKYVPVNYYRRAEKSKIRVFSYTIGFIKSYLRIIWYKLICAESAVI